MGEAVDRSADEKDKDPKRERSVEDIYKERGFIREYTVTSGPFPDPGRVAQYVSLLERSLEIKKISDFAIIPSPRNEEGDAKRYAVMVKKGPNWKQPLPD